MSKIKLSEWAERTSITEEAVRLLRKTIDKKWIPIVNKKGVDDGIANCYLCKRFRRWGRYCSGCPILQETGERKCDGTPYVYWHRHHIVEHYKRIANRFPHKVECLRCKEIAQEEVDWLEVLYKKCIKED